MPRSVVPTLGMCIMAAWKMLMGEARMKNLFVREEAGRLGGFGLEGPRACFETRWN